MRISGGELKSYVPFRLAITFFNGSYKVLGLELNPGRGALIEISVLKWARYLSINLK